MKVYLFNIDNGLYEGEDFSDPAKLCETDGVTCLPPPEYQPGYVPVYDQSLNRWKLVPADSFKSTESRHA